MATKSALFFFFVSFIFIELFEKFGLKQHIFSVMNEGCCKLRVSIITVVVGVIGLFQFIGRLTGSLLG